MMIQMMSVVFHLLFKKYLKMKKQQKNSPNKGQHNRLKDKRLRESNPKGLDGDKSKCASPQCFYYNGFSHIFVQCTNNKKKSGRALISS